MSDRYEIRDKIGQGGVGAVYKAFDTQLKREVALKRLLPPEDGTVDPATSEKFTEDLLKEATTLSSLQHPNIVTIYDVGKDDKGPFVVMELLRGETFDETIGRGALPIDDFKKVVTQSLEAIIAAHDAGLVHRDLKPGNLMVIWLPSGKFQIKILDFGLAKFGKLPSKQTADQEDGILGSIYFMAPEQFERIGLDARTDMYALGCIFYYALTGKYPFEGDNAPQVMAAHLQHRVIPLEGLRPDLPPWLASWVMWLISREMKDRPADAKQAFEFYNREASGLESRRPRPGDRSRRHPAEKSTDRDRRAETRACPTRLLNPGTPAATGAKTKALASGSQSGVPVGQTTSQMQHPSQRDGAIPVEPVAMPKTGYVAPVKKPFPFPKWALVTIPLLGIAAFAIYKMKTGNREVVRAYYDELVVLTEAEEPAGDASTVQMLVDVVEEGGNNAIAAIQTLERLQGDGVEKAIVEQLHKVRTPLGKEGLIGVITRRKIEGSITDIARYMSDKYPKKIREAAVYSIGVIGSESDLIDLMRELKSTEDKNTRDILEAAIVNLSMLNPDMNKRTTRIRTELEGTANGPYRNSLLYMLAQLGGDRAWKDLSSALDRGDTEEKKAVLRGLTQWPDFEPGEKLAGIIRSTDDKVVRMFAVRAYSSLLLRPSATSAGDKVASIAAVLKVADSRKDKEELLSVASRLIDPAALELMRSFESDPSLGATAKYVSQILEEELKKVIDVAGDTTLPAKKAIIEADENADIEYEAKDNAIIGWNREYYGVVWPINVTQPGKYAITVLQASANEQEQTYTISVAGQSLESKVVVTGGVTDFKPVDVGELDIVNPGSFKLSMSGKKMADYGDLMSLREVTLKRVGDATPAPTSE